MKNLVLNVIKEQQNQLHSEFNEAIAKLNKAASDTWATAMQFKRKEIDAIVNALEASKELTWVDNDEYVWRWVRVDFGTLIDESNETERDLLSEYFRDNYHTECNFKDSAVLMCDGPVIVINEDGDVYDQDASSKNRWIVSRKDYETKEELFKLIEAYMDKTGWYPSVIRADRHGNVSYVNTQSN